jgi:predicted ATPase
MIVDRESVGGGADGSPTWHELGRGLNETAMGEGSDTAVAMARKVQLFCWGICLYHLSDTTREAPIRQPGYIDDNRELRSDGRNLAAVLYRLRKQSPESPRREQSAEPLQFDYYGRVVKTIRQFAPWFEGFAIEPLELNAKNVQLDWHENGAERLFGPHELPDGALRAMALTTLLLQPPKYLPSCIVIDEPELGLHPAAASIIAALLRAAALRCQVIVATQSPTFLDEFDPEDVIVVDREHGASTFTRQDPERLHDWLEEYSLGELWQKNVMGGGPF